MAPLIPSDTILSFSSGVYTMFVDIYRARNSMDHNQFRILPRNAGNICVGRSSNVLEISWYTNTYASHFIVALQKLWNLNVGIAESYLRKWILWASRSRISEIIKLGRTYKETFQVDPWGHKIKNKFYWCWRT